MNDEIALQRLAIQYAIAADEGDGQAFTECFLPEGSILVYYRGHQDPDPRRIAGHATLAKIPASLSDRFDRTLHFVGQTAYEVGSDEASGVVYCLAHHFRSTPTGGVDYVQHSQYRDSYARDHTGSWKISERRVYVHWTEERVTKPADWQFPPRPSADDSPNSSQDQQQV